MTRGRRRVWCLASLALACAAGCDDGGGATADDDDDDAGAIESIVVEPADATAIIQNGLPAVVEYTAKALHSDGTTEDVTSLATFSCADTSLGSFGGDNTFETTAYVGGETTITATLGEASGSTGLTILVRFVALSEGVPDDAPDMFQGAEDPSRAPSIVYPPNGVLMPPNLADVEFQWDGGEGNDIWRVTFRNDFLDAVVYVASPSFVPDGLLWQAVSAGNAGRDVTIRVAGTAMADPLTLGESDPIDVWFAEEVVEGGLYYWAASSTVNADYGIYRYDFGQPGQDAEQVYTTAQTSGRCVACHALSHDGTRMALNYDGGGGPADIVSVSAQEPIMPPENAYNANFHAYSADDAYVLAVSQGVFTLRDGTTGALIETLPLVNVTNPDWSRDGTLVAFTRVTADPYGCDWAFAGGQIEIMTFDGPGNWGEPVVLVPAEPGVNFYYPAISPDNEWVLFNRSTGDSYSDDDATLWVVSSQGGDPMPLDAVNLEGNLRTSWAKWCPHEHVFHEGPLMWLTVSSMRDYGNVLVGALLPQIWMAGFDPERAADGEDPSWPAFYLPFQDITTNNHIPQWTDVVVPLE